MPYYNYVCPKCGGVREVLLGVQDRDRRVGNKCDFHLDCPGKLERTVTLTHFRLSDKGNHGWASNGYADNVLGNDPSWRKENGYK